MVYCESLLLLLFSTWLKNIWGVSQFSWCTPEIANKTTSTVLHILPYFYHVFVHTASQNKVQVQYFHHLNSNETTRSWSKSFDKPTRWSWESPCKWNISQYETQTWNWYWKKKISIANKRYQLRKKQKLLATKPRVDLKLLQSQLAYLENRLANKKISPFKTQTKNWH